MDAGLLALLLGASTLLQGLLALLLGATRSRDATRGSGLLLGAKDATRGSWPYYWEQGRY